MSLTEQELTNAKQGIIYRFEVYNYHYIGQTKLTMKERFRQHKRSCLGLDKNHIDNSRKYIIMRNLGITADNFDELVKCRVIQVCRLEEIDYYENLNITIGEFSLNHQHSLYYLDGYYTKDYKENGAYTQEERKARNLISSNLRNKGRVDLKREEDLKLREKNICGCCNYKTHSKANLKKHKKSLKHAINEMESIE